MSETPLVANAVPHVDATNTSNQLEQISDAEPNSSSTSPCTAEKIFFRKLSILMPTRNVNHTEIYKQGSALSGFKEEGFKTMFRTEPSRDKNLESREHDEVISRAVKAMGLSCQFQQAGSKRLPFRVVRIFATYFNEDQKKEIETKLNRIIKSCQRKPQSLTIVDTLK